MVWGARSQMNTKYFLTLKTILETGSFQKAAEKLNYTQSTVTFHIQQLEEELSLKLFEKVGRKMVLTQAGNDLLPHIETILREAEFITRYGEHIAEPSGFLRVGMPDFLLCYRIQPVISEFQKRAPQVRLMIPTLSCQSIQTELLHGNLDIGIHCITNTSPPSILRRPWASYKAVLVASKNANPEMLDFKKPHQRKEINLITSDSNSRHQKNLIRYLAERNIIVENNIDIGSLDAAKASVVNNLGIAYFPDFTVSKELEDGTLIAIPLELDSQPVPVVCAYHKNKWVTPAMDLFIRLMFDLPEDIRKA